MQNKKLTDGNLLSNILIFSLPLMLSGILQLLFNAADTIVVGRFAGKASLAAVGSTTSLIQLLVNLFIGLAVGANVVAAHFVGAQKSKEANETMHSSIALSLWKNSVIWAVKRSYAQIYQKTVFFREQIYPFTKD